MHGSVGQGQYKQAFDLAQQALKSMPRDATLHEFSALCLFALGKYRQSAATLNAVLAVEPGWDWTTKGKKEQVVKGAYALDRNALAMEPAAGGVMLAEVAPQANGSLSFKMIGAPDKEPPLQFTR